MKIRRIDSEGDWDYGHSMSSYYVDNAQSVGLNIVTRLREWYRDCFFAMDKGIDYPTRLGSFNQKENLDNDIQSVIMNSQDVVDITEFDSTFDRNTRHYSCQAKVLHIYSDEALPIYFNTEGII
jgi:hypothetical protein